jgi:hypothetical protein
MKISPGERILAALQETDHSMKRLILSYVRDAAAAATEKQKGSVLSDEEKARLLADYVQNKKAALSNFEFVADEKFKELVREHFDKKLDPAFFIPVEKKDESSQH